MRITAKRVEWAEIPELTDGFFGELGYKNDGFFIDNVFAGDAYLIESDGVTAGFFSRCSSFPDTNGSMSGAFRIIPEYRAISKDAFSRIADEFGIGCALAASNDHLMISLSFERMREAGGAYDMQAYLFLYGEPKRPPEFKTDALFPVTDFEKMNAETEKQWDGMSDGKCRFYM